MLMIVPKWAVSRTPSRMATSENVTLAYVDQGYTGEKVAEAAQQRGIELAGFV